VHQLVERVAVVVSLDAQRTHARFEFRGN